MLDKKFLSDFVQTLIARGQPDMAEKLIYTISQDYPNEPSHLLLLAEIVLTMGNPKAAHNYLNSAVNILDALNMKLDFNDEIVELQSQISKYEEQLTAQSDNSNTGDLTTQVDNDFKAQNFLDTLKIDMDDNQKGYNERHVFHPYFGFTQRPRKDPNQIFNNYGFSFLSDPIDYPFVPKNKDTYIAAIFGGSVAAHYARHEREAIEIALSNHPKLQDKEVRVLPFAQGGWAQPQSLQALSYFGSTNQHFDLVINIDGFNEALAKRWQLIEGCFPGMPQFGIIRHLRMALQPMNLTGEAANYASNLLKLSFKMDKIRGSLGHPLWKLLLTPVLNFYQQRYNKKIASPPSVNIDQNDDYLLLHKIRPLTENQIENDDQVLDWAINEAVGYWKNSSLLMSGLCQKLDATYFHVLQPNQYFGSKPFSSEEKKMFIERDSLQDRVIRQTYPAMKKNADWFKGKHVNFIDMTNAFEGVSTTCYQDAVCHLNADGDRYLSKRLIPKILDSL